MCPSAPSFCLPSFLAHHLPPFPFDPVVTTGPLPRRRRRRRPPPFLLTTGGPTRHLTNSSSLRLVPHPVGTLSFVLTLLGLFRTRFGLPRVDHGRKGPPRPRPSLNTYTQTPGDPLRLASRPPLPPPDSLFVPYLPPFFCSFFIFAGRNTRPGVRHAKLQTTTERPGPSLVAGTPSPSLETVRLPARSPALSVSVSG